MCKKKSLILILFTMLLLLFNTSITYGIGTTIQLTYNSYYDWYPQINNNNYVVWWQGKYGNDYEIFLYDGSKIIQLTDNNYTDWYPQINNNNYVAWRGHDGKDYEIFLYDGSKTTNISDNSYDDGDDGGPQINDNNYVTWVVGYFPDNEIFLYLDGVILEPKVYLPNITKNYAGWSTPFIVQNQGTADANIKTSFINANGQEVNARLKLGLEPDSSWTVNPAGEKSLGKFKGSVGAYADQVVTTVVNQHSPYSSMAYEGVMTTNATSKVHLPNITRNYYGWTTPFIVQNVDTDDTTVEVKFYRKGHSSPVLTLNRTIKPAESKSINPSLYPVLGTSFQGSVVVESTNGKKIAAVVNEHKGKGKAMSYNGLSQGQDTVFLPNITRGYFGWTTSFIIQNTGAEATTLTVEYYKRGENTPVYTQNLPSIAPRTTKSINQRDIKALGVFCGSAVVKAETGKEIVAIVNEHSGDDNMAYSGITEGNTTNYLPNITKNYAGWTTPFIVQNIDSTNAEVDIKFYKKATSTPVFTITRNIKPMASMGINPGNYKSLGKSFQGSVVVESTNGKNITAVVNEHHTTGQAMAYNGQ